MNAEYAIALSTFPDAATAKKIARDLVAHALVACANIVSSVDSIYRWQGKVEESNETLVVFKLTSARYAEFEARLRELHPYDVPEIIRLDLAGGSADYLRWISESCARD
ncbi:MAG: divalent-cation tolerance protein CutA [Verrucomicrobiota bacterium]|nr:divalent-cation tolerance protein CutA [Verrucomicrobiota bacterium]